MTDNLSWNDYFMLTAKLASHKSRDPVTKVGACIVNNDNHVIGIGYNGMPVGIPDEQDYWFKPDDPMFNKHNYVCHAEMNCILNCSSKEKNCSMYVTLFPCNNCAKYIVNSRMIARVYYCDMPNKLKDSYFISEKILRDCNIETIYYVIENTTILI